MGDKHKYTKEELKELREANPHIIIPDDDKAVEFFEKERQEQNEESKRINSNKESLTIAVRDSFIELGIDRVMWHH